LRLFEEDFFTLGTSLKFNLDRFTKRP